MRDGLPLLRVQAFQQGNNGFGGHPSRLGAAADIAAWTGQLSRPEIPAQPASWAAPTSRGRPAGWPTNRGPPQRAPNRYSSGTSVGVARVRVSFLKKLGLANRQ